MRTTDRNSIPSMSAKMQGLRISDPSEKALMVRLGTLIDAIVEAQRGKANPGEGIRRANINNLKKAKKATGTTENLFNAVSVKLNSTTTSSNLSHQEVQIALSPSFNDPIQKQVFSNSAVFKGLVENGTYSVRARLVTKDGQVNDWAVLDSVRTSPGTVAADLDGTYLGTIAESKQFTIVNSGKQFFCSSSFGFTSVVDSVTTTTTPSTTATQSKIKWRIGASYVYSDVEEITFQGIPRTATTLNSPFLGLSKMTVRRNNPIIFFTLLTPTIASYPAVRTLDVQRADGNAAYAASTKDTVWVEF